MPCIYIMTEDKRLCREITLAAHPYFVTASLTEATALVIDLDTCPVPETALPLLVIGSDPKKAASYPFFLCRPFSLDGVKEKLDCLLSRPDQAALTPTEERLLGVLMRAEGKTVSRDLLIREVWGDTGSEELLNPYIHYLRQKTEKDGKRRIFASRGKGYFYRATSDH